MRIVHVADSFSPDVGGIESQVEALALRQRADGHDVSVITAVHFPAPEVDRQIDVVRASSGRWLTVAFPWRDHRMVAKVLDGAPIDVVHVHLTVISPLAIYVLRAASRRRIPVAVTVHSTWWKVAMATRVCLLPFGVGPMRAVWSAVSAEAAYHVRRTLPGVGRVLVVPNLVDTSWWRALTSSPAPVRTPRRLVLVGRLKRRKQIGEFLDLLARARERVPPTTRADVVVVGEGPRQQDLEEQVTRQGLVDWVTLTGHRDAEQIRALHQDSDVFVAPSRHESFGIAALEARAAGLPVLGYRATGLRDFVVDGVDGRLVRDDDEMVDVLVELLTTDVVEPWKDAARRTPPPVDPAVAMAAVDALYERTRTTLGPRPVASIGC